jgi:hypothetical protein
MAGDVEWAIGGLLVSCGPVRLSCLVLGSGEVTGSGCVAPARVGC